MELNFVGIVIRSLVVISLALAALMFLKKFFENSKKLKLGEPAVLPGELWDLKATGKIGMFYNVFFLLLPVGLFFYLAGMFFGLFPSLP